jgi:L-cysteine/cystine lyase
MPVDPAALGADAYAFPAQKWLLGPGGLGALWVRREALDRFDCTFTGVASGTDHMPDGAFRRHDGAHRFEMALSPEALIPGWLASLRWIGGLGGEGGGRGIPWVARRTRAAVDAARAALEGVGATVLTPAGQPSGLLTFTVEGIDAEPAAAALEARGVIVRWVPFPRALRASIGFYTESNDIERLAAGVADLTG